MTDTRVLAAIAACEKRLVPCTTQGIARRLGLSFDVTRHHVRRLCVEGLAEQHSQNESEFLFRLTAEGWERAGEKLPLWMAAA